MKPLKPIKPLTSESLVDKVETRLLQFFKENKLVPGDAIPKEMEFAESLGVSRTVVREALLRLRTLGLVESRKRRGMILTQPNIITNFSRILDPLLLGEDTLRQLFELRLIMEMGMADFLFENRREKDLKQLEKIVAAEEAEEPGEIRFTLEREVAFHGKLYTMSRNETLQQFQQLLLPVFNYVYLQETERTTPESYHYSSGEFVSHRMIYEVLRDGTPQEFREKMRQHLEPHFDHVFSTVREMSL